MGDNTETDGHWSIHTGDDPENVSPVDADFSDGESDEGGEDVPELKFKHRPDSNRVIAQMRDSNPFMEIFGYDTGSDDEANLCCSECGERVDFVVEKPEDLEDDELHWHTPKANILGAVCGCRETPEKWTVGEV